jgi:hypothetical protein
MLERPQLQADTITRPFQMLAAWLVGLVLIDGIFLETALRLDAGGWERKWLVVAAILNVPAFLAALFTLQTRFRAELQDDPHYERYLGQKAADELGLAWYDDGEPAPGEEPEAAADAEDEDEDEAEAETAAAPAAAA